MLRIKNCEIKQKAWKNFCSLASRTLNRVRIPGSRSPALILVKFRYRSLPRTFIRALLIHRVNTPILNLSISFRVCALPPREALWEIYWERIVLSFKPLSSGYRIRVSTLAPVNHRSSSLLFNTFFSAYLLLHLSTIFSVVQCVTFDLSKVFFETRIQLVWIVAFFLSLSFSVEKNHQIMFVINHCDLFLLNNDYSSLMYANQSLYFDWLIAVSYLVALKDFAMFFLFLSASNSEIIYRSAHHHS